MYEFTVIKATEKERWESIIKRCMFYDIYHTHFYHSFENSLSPSPILIISEFNDELISFPLKLRSIEDTGYYDLTSVYGYCGPISNKEFTEISPHHFDLFRENFYNFCKENYVVSVFSRLHPLNNYHDFFENFGEKTPINKTIVIDVRTSEEEQVKSYRKSTRHEIRYLRQKDYEIVETRDPKAIDDFINMYYKTMKKVRAFDRYYFDKDYFHGFLNNSDYDVKLLMAKKDSKFAAGAIFTIAGDVMQYHLASTEEQFISDAPMKLILDEARKIAIKNNLKYLHLGGGFAGRDDDNLFLFKSGFSKIRLQFSIWKHIVDVDQYNKLVNFKNMLNSINTNFPLYRS